MWINPSDRMAHLVTDFNNLAIAGRQDPQFVPAFRQAPTASTLVSDSLAMAARIVFVPMSKQTQTIGPRSAAGFAGRPASSATDDGASSASSWAASHSRDGRPPAFEI